MLSLGSLTGIDLFQGGLGCVVCGVICPVAVFVAVAAARMAPKDK